MDTPDKTPADLARRLNLPISTTNDLRARENWPHHKFGRHVRFTDAQIEEIVRRHLVTKEASAEPKPMFEGALPHRPRGRAS